MKKLKYLLFFFITFLSPIVFADTSYDMTSRITSPVNYSECGAGSYTGVELNGATNCWNTKTRYQGTLNRIYFNLPAPTGSVFESDTAYRLTIKMATDDWRNNFGTVVVSPGSSYTNNFVDTFTFVSMKQVNITFTVPYSGSTTYQYLYVNLPAKNSSSLITGVSNWNLSNVTLTKLTSGSGGGSSTPSGPSTTFDDTAIINSGKENTQDIINNNNNNTSDIINNNNNNTEEIKDSITENLNSCRNSYNLLNPDSLYLGNISTETGQNSYGDFVVNSDYISIDNDYNSYSFRYNTYSSLPQIVAYFYDNSKNYIGFDVINNNAGSLSISSNIKFIRVRFNGDFNNSFNFQIETGSIVHPFEKYGERVCTSKLDDVNNSINNSTSTIINNQNENTNKQIESQKVCTTSVIDSSVSFSSSKHYLNSSGNYVNDPSYSVTDYIKVTKIKKLTTIGNAPSICFYKSDKSLISCSTNSSVPIGNVSIPTDTYYARFSINFNYNAPTYEIEFCTNGNQAIQDSLTDSNIDNGVGNSFFDNFNNNMHGLSSIITIPLSSIQSLSSSQCTPLHFPIPFTDNKYLDVPCMTEIYEQHVPTLLTLIQTCWYGILAYKVLVNIFGIVKGFKDPDSDKIEVMDL